MTQVQALAGYAARAKFDDLLGILVSKRNQ